ncbi:MAG: SMC-Scp complex subunit ScpB, partial [Actinomycetes bacterium]
MTMTDDELACGVEAVLTVALEPVPASALADLMGESEERTAELLRTIRERLITENRGFVLVELASGWRIQSNPVAADVVQRYAQRDLSARLSTAALET